MKKIAVVLASLLVVACSTTQKSVSPLSSGDSAKTVQASGSNVTTGAGLLYASMSAANSKLNSISNAAATDKRVAAEHAVQNQSIYFDYDKYLVKPQFRGQLQKQAEFIRKHKGEVVTLEGNADERGSKEYNLALGNQRAVAVEKSLKLLGVPAAQIKTVSYGEEKPRLLCHEEKCWKENRRVDFVLSSVALHSV